jgi:hypothetical protein
VEVCDVTTPTPHDLRGQVCRLRKAQKKLFFSHRPSQAVKVALLAEVRRMEGQVDQLLRTIRPGEPLRDEVARMRAAQARWVHGSRREDLHASRDAERRVDRLLRQAAESRSLFAQEVA